jgi:hypothetical protein
VIVCSFHRRATKTLVEILSPGIRPHGKASFVLCIGFWIFTLKATTAAGRSADLASGLAFDEVPHRLGDFPALGGDVLLQRVSHVLGCVPRPPLDRVKCHDTKDVVVLSGQEVIDQLDVCPRRVPEWGGLRINRCGGRAFLSITAKTSSRSTAPLRYIGPRQISRGKRMSDSTAAPIKSIIDEPSWRTPAAGRLAITGYTIAAVR